MIIFSGLNTRTILFKLGVSVGILAVFVAGCAKNQSAEVQTERLEPWQPGYLDIHHINTGRGDAAYFIFPDGTTMLFDVGDLDEERIKNYAPLELVPAHPSAVSTPGEWISKYVRTFAPNTDPTVDFAVISHFHSDHYGHISDASRQSTTGPYKLSGITEVSEQLGIRTIIDRAYPSYDYPIDLRLRKDPTLQNYFNFADFRRIQDPNSMQVMAVGSTTQISMRYDPDAYPEFNVRNVKVNAEIWDRDSGTTNALFAPDDILDADGNFNENPLSLALTVNYGSFDYFTGGDMTGLQGFGLPTWFDVESPVGRSVGEVDVLALNHHGNRDATNADFLEQLRPKAIVQQSWVSDHPGGEVLHRMAYSQKQVGGNGIFATNIVDATKTAIGPWLTTSYASDHGHVVIRVFDKGSKYDIFVLDDESEDKGVLERFGPFESL